MTNNQEKQLRRKLTKWLQAKGETPEDVKRKMNAWLQYFEGIKKPVVAFAACTWLCSGAVILPEDMPKVEQAVRIAEINRVDPLRFDRPMAVFETFPSTELKEAPIDPDTVPTLHLAKRFDSGLAIYNVDEGPESRENMRRIINTHFGKDASPWCLLQGDGDGNLTEGSLKHWNHYNAYPKQVAFVDGKLAAFSVNSNSEKVWWDRMDESHEDVVVSGRIKEDLLGRSASCCFNPETGDVRYEDIIRRRDNVFVKRYVDIEDRVYILDILVDPKKKEKITSVVIPGSVTKIGNGAFAGCSSLQEIHIPDSVKVIGNAAFDGCTSLQEVRIPDGVKEIGPYVFKGCASLQEIHIPDSVTEIGFLAFSDCTSMEEAYISEGVKEIGRDAFYGCSSLKEIYIPEGVTEIGCGTFEGCSSLKEIHIPDSVKVIGATAFKGCTSLGEIHIPDGVTKIGNGAFMGCSSLQEIHIPDGVTIIGYKAFCGCSSLQKIHIPEGVTEIGESAFEACFSLQEIHIPDGVTKIGNGAFDDCTSLKEVHVSTTAPQALIDRLHEVVPGGCAVLRDLPEEDLAVLRERGVSEVAIRELQEKGSVHIKEKTFYRPSTETSPCPESARTVHTDVVAALEDGSVRMKDPKTGKNLGDTKSFFSDRKYLVARTLAMWASKSLSNGMTKTHNCHQ